MTYNEALHDIRHRDVDIKRWTNTNLNRWLADYISSFSAPLRFVGELDAVARGFQTHLVLSPQVAGVSCCFKPPHFPLGMEFFARKGLIVQELSIAWKLRTSLSQRSSSRLAQVG